MSTDSETDREYGSDDSEDSDASTRTAAAPDRSGSGGVPEVTGGLAARAAKLPGVGSASTPEAGSPEEAADPAGEVALDPSAEGYALALPDFLPPHLVTEEVAARLREVGVLAREAGIAQDIVQRMIELYTDRSITDASGVDLENPEAVLAHLRLAWGPEADGKIKAAQAAVQRLGPKFARWLDETLLGNDPAMIAVLADFDQGVLTLAPSQAAAELAKIHADPKHPFWSGTHPGHKVAVERVRALAQRAHVGEETREAKALNAPRKPGARADAPLADKRQAELDKLRIDPAYSDKSRPNHKQVVARVTELYRAIYGDAPLDALG